MIGATSRLLIVHTPRPADEARAILGALLADDGTSSSASGVLLVDGAVDAAQVSFTAIPRHGASLAFSGTIDETPDGSALVGSISAPMALGVPVVLVTVLVALFLALNGIPLPLVAIGVVAWIFLSVIVVNSLEEQRLDKADAIVRWLEDALAVADTPA